MWNIYSCLTLVREVYASPAAYALSNVKVSNCFTVSVVVSVSAAVKEIVCDIGKFASIG